jgi:general secretion pathway protein H
VRTPKPNTFIKVSEADGFTLLELMIVLFLAMVMMGMGIIAMVGRLPAAKLDATVREMSAMIRHSRILAKVQGEEQAIVVDLDAQSYGFEGKNPRRIPEEIRLKIDDSLTGDANQGIHRMVFSPFGGVDGGTVVLSTGQRSISIKPDPVMGFVINRKKQD